MYNIYKITNNINGMIYIGCTTKSIQERLNSHKNAYKRKNNDLYIAMREFGFDNFSVEVVEHGEDNNIRYDREVFYISKMDSTNPSIGYNRTIGGRGTIGYVFTDADKIKISNANRGRIVSDRQRAITSKIWKGKKLPKEIRDKISKSRIGKYSGKDNSFYGKHHTEETKLAIGTANSNIIQGTNIKTGDILMFDSVTKASEFIKETVKPKGLVTTVRVRICASAANPKSRGAYGYRWVYV